MNVIEALLRFQDAVMARSGGRIRVVRLDREAHDVFVREISPISVFKDGAKPSKAARELVVHGISIEVAE